MALTVRRGVKGSQGPRARVPGRQLRVWRWRSSAAPPKADGDVGRWVRCRGRLAGVIRCQATIERHLALAIGPTRLSLSEVEELEQDRLVQIEDPIADEDERGDMRFENGCLLERRCRQGALWLLNPEFPPVPVRP